MDKPRPIMLLNSSGGCAAKLGPSSLAEILGCVTYSNSPVAEQLKRWEDATVLDLGSGIQVAQSVDVIGPVSNDPYTFGAVAAAHGLSDLYAKGALPVSGLVILAMPPMEVSTAVASAIIQGISDKLAEAGAATVGGHTLASQDLLAGVAVTGTVDRFCPNTGANVGDLLVLTKPLGSGIVITAHKLRLAGEPIELPDNDTCGKAERWMLDLNAGAARVLARTQVSACTDVSGFGLVGHLFSLLGDKCAVLNSEAIPLMHGVSDLLAQGVFPAGGDRNIAEWMDLCSFETGYADDRMLAYFDPQTSGGLLMSVPENELSFVLSDLEETGTPSYVVGTVRDPSTEGIRICVT
jgi:selenide,water dikinase